MTNTLAQLVGAPLLSIALGGPAAPRGLRVMNTTSDPFASVSHSLLMILAPLLTAVLLGLLAGWANPPRPEGKKPRTTDRAAAVAAVLFLMLSGGMLVTPALPCLIALTVVVAVGTAAKRWPKPKGPTRTARLGEPDIRLSLGRTYFVVTGISVLLLVGLAIAGAVLAAATPTWFHRAVDQREGGRLLIDSPSEATALVVFLVALFGGAVWAWRRVDYIPPTATQPARWERWLASRRVLRAACAGPAACLALLCKGLFQAMSTGGWNLALGRYPGVTASNPHTYPVLWAAYGFLVLGIIAALMGCYGLVAEPFAPPKESATTASPANVPGTGSQASLS